ncbi:MAG: OadG-related small transporter subunit [Peptoniphilus harei]|mgnify:FL=1|nr:OadG-related small transporter subunit [Peptoniphilus harei]MDU4046481.1 OadG-related small transporter subunit [Peptoniphilus harei]MDU7114338.1 OadG-related small transporter subunit [Peptoniphilus harei]
MDMTVFTQGVEVALWGLAGVFAVLILFYIFTKIMLKVFKEK